MYITLKLNNVNYESWTDIVTVAPNIHPCQYLMYKGIVNKIKSDRFFNDQIMSYRYISLVDSRAISNEYIYLNISYVCVKLNILCIDANE